MHSWENMVEGSVFLIPRPGLLPASSTIFGTNGFDSGTTEHDSLLDPTTTHTLLAK